MGFWNRQSATERRYRATVTLPSWDGIAAAAQPFDIDKPQDREKLAKLQQQWQTDAWLYLDRVGELKDAYRFVENSFYRLGVYAAFHREPDAAPIPVADAVDRPDGVDGVDAGDLLPVDVADLAEAIVRDFAARDGGQQTLLARLGVNIFMVGDALIIQRAVPERRAVDGEDPSDVPRVWDWEVRSLHEVRKSRSGHGVETVDAPDQQDGVPVEGLDGEPPFVERVYRKHGQWMAWADSNVKAAIDSLEEIRLLDLVARASLRSRAMAGVWRAPEELDFGGTDLPGGAPGPTTQGVTFERALSEAFAAAIGNEADPNSVAPVIVRGKAEFLNSDVFGPIEMPRRYASDERAQREDAVKKLGRTIELPLERIVGLGDINHWGAWQVDETTYRAYIEPLANVVAEALTYGLLRPRLADAGVDARWLDRVSVAVDASRLIRRADVGKTGEALHERGTISDAALRRVNEFGDEDAPSDEELLRRWLLRSGAPPDIVVQLLHLTDLVDRELPQPIALAPAPADDPDDPDDPDDDPGDPRRGPPPEQDDRGGSGPPGDAVTAALSASRDVGRALASIDAVLLERLLTACDQAVARVLERIGARLRSKPKTQQPSALRQALLAAKDVPNAMVARTLDAALVVAAVGSDPVTDDDFADLESRFAAWVAAAQDASLRELAASTEVSDETLSLTRARQDQDRRDGWTTLLAALVAYTLALVGRGEDHFDDTGEWDPTVTVSPAIVREALAVAGGSQVERGAMGGVFAPGGAPLGGVATGSTVQRAFAEAGQVFGDWEWEYGSAPRQRPYEPHLALDGAPSSAWAGFMPGDHAHCRCSSVPRLVRAASSQAA